MSDLPITLCFFTSTKGHHKRLDDYKLTLNHWGSQIDLKKFNLVSHIKVSEGEEQIGNEIEKDLQDRGFQVVKTTNNWKRGLSMGANYLSDMCKMARFISSEQTPRVRPYFLLLEDDSLAISHKVNLEELWREAVNYLKSNPNTLTVRLRRRNDDIGPVIQHLNPDERYFWSKDTNFQPLLIRFEDYQKLCRILEHNPQVCERVQCELLWRIILCSFHNVPYKHIVWNVDYAESVHLGVPNDDYQKHVQKYNLK